MTRQAKVIADFVAENEEEISIPANSIINVLSVEDDGWCVVEYDGNQGYFPPTYLTYDIDINPENEEEDESNSKSEEYDESLETNMSEPGSQLEETTDDTAEPLTEESIEISEQEIETPEEKAIRKEEQRRKHRINVINEIRTTEADYVNDIAIIVEVFSKPLSESGLLNPVDMVGLFSNIEVLVNVNQKLLAELEANPDNENIMIGVIFLGMVILRISFFIIL